jgi:hypothetical protein
MMEWTSEKLSAYSTEQIKTLRENASRKGNADVVAMCDAELLRRKPTKSKPNRSISASSHSGEVVLGFHFVCANEQGVVRNSDGTAWTGTWVVAREHAERAPVIGTYVALHSTKSERSYLQGTIKDVRRRERERSYAEGQTVQTEFGYDFQFELTDIPYEWQGGGSGEKGYAWGRAGVDGS